jgi:hypothetical protein
LKLSSRSKYVVCIGTIAFCTLFLWWPGLLNAGQKQQEAGFFITAQRWEEAEKLFHSDPRWLGGDGASSVNLGIKRVLWLFGDSFINTKGSSTRRDAVMVRNSIAVQSGRNPAKATMRFYWKSTGGKPASFFREEGDQWFWPGSGVSFKGTLIIFLVKVRGSKSDLRFEPSGWNAVLVHNPGSVPSAWCVRHLACPVTGCILVGSSSLLIKDGYLYAFSTDWKDNSVYLVRWPVNNAFRGDLSRPRWWMGSAGGWVDIKPVGLNPVPVFTKGQVEFTVHYEPLLKAFLMVQTLSLREPCLAMRSSPGLIGPWTGPECFFQPPQKTLPGLLIYAGKAHKVFMGADLTLTYAVNTTDKERIMDDMSIYYPVVLKAKISLRK